MEVALYFQEEINQIPGLYVLGSPVGTLVSFGSKDSSLNILAVADVMEQQHKWTMERQTNPSCLHCTVNPAHGKVKEEFVADLRKSVEYVRAHPELANTGSAAMYGMVAKVPAPELVENFLLTYLSKIYQ